MPARRLSGKAHPLQTWRPKFDTWNSHVGRREWSPAISYPLTFTHTPGHTCTHRHAHMQIHKHKHTQAYT